MSDEGPILGSGWIPFFSIIALIFGLFVGIKTMKVDPRVGAAIIAVCAIPAIVYAVQLIRLFRALGRAELEMKEDVVPLGWRGTATYTRPLRGASLRSVEARLQCEEHVERGSGRSHREWTKVVLDEPLSPQSIPMMERLQITIPIKIPTGGPPSFTYTDNEIRWFLRLRLRMEGCPDTRSSFRISVLPAVIK